jgi:hypothetical protein
MILSHDRVYQLVSLLLEEAKSVNDACSSDYNISCIAIQLRRICSSFDHSHFTMAVNSGATAPLPDVMVEALSSVKIAAAWSNPYSNCPHERGRRVTQ